MSNFFFLQAQGRSFYGISFVALIFLLCIYFLPTIIGVMRKKPNAGAIFVLNLFLGWSIIGWVVSLVWAVSADTQAQNIVVNNHVSADRTINPVISPDAKAWDKESTQNVQVLQDQRSLIQNSTLSSQQNKIDQLQQLKQLLDSGILTQEEFAEQKSKILSA